MTKNISILSHRGLDLSLSNHRGENTSEAFEYQLGNGFGIEFDVNVTCDGELIVFHDPDLTKFTNLRDTRRIDTIDSKSFLTLRDSTNSRLCTLKDILLLITHQEKELSALHIKAQFQTTAILSQIFETLCDFRAIIPRLLIFDLMPNAARFLKNKFTSNDLSPLLAASVADAFDIERFSTLTGGTLMSIEEVIAHNDLFDWCWLDEWDLISRSGEKSLLNEAVFETCRSHGLKIGLVTPELHAFAPNQSWNAHQDAAPMERLLSRFKDIVQLTPDAICTDYPSIIKNIIAEEKELSHN
jgi:glycerophosphoryl diester phosphodiesterase